MRLALRLLSRWYCGCLVDYAPASAAAVRDDLHMNEKLVALHRTSGNDEDKASTASCVASSQVYRFLVCLTAWGKGSDPTLTA